jgi:phospholipid-binding lipoprotein MlaA
VTGRARPGHCVRIAALAVAVGFLGGCATAEVTNPSKADPLEAFNRPIFAFNDTVDRYALRPIARVYDRAVPEVVQLVVGNVFSNLADVYTAANQLLQGKPREAMQDISRFVVNSTWGMLGLGDVASAIGLRKHNEDFGQTLGVWGVPSGPYLVIPFLGPSTMRDAPSRIVDARGDPVWRRLTDVALRNSAVGLRVVHQRADLLDTERTLRGVTLDRYSLFRDGYLQRRNSAVYDGNPPDELPDYGEEDYYEPSEDTGGGSDGGSNEAGAGAGSAEAEKGAGAAAGSAPATAPAGPGRDPGSARR